MDQDFLDLQRRLMADPADGEALTQLARSVLKLGDPVKAYSLLVDRGNIDCRSPLLIEIGGLLARAEKSILRKKLGVCTQFAVDKLEVGWRWLDSQEVRAEGLPVLAIKIRCLTRPEKRLLKNLASFASLQELYLEHSEITDKGLTHLASLTSLNNLQLRWTRITDEGLAELASLTALQDLGLWGTKVTRECAQELLPFVGNMRF